MVLQNADASDIMLVTRVGRYFNQKIGAVSMKKLVIVSSVLLVILAVACVAYSQMPVKDLAKMLGMDKPKRIAVVCEKLGLYPVYVYKKNGGSRFYVTATPPPAAQALIDFKNGVTKAIPPADAAVNPSLDIKVKHKEKAIKDANKDYAPATWETYSGKVKIKDDTLDTSFDANTTINISANGYNFQTTLGDGDDPTFDGDKGKSVYQGQYFPGSYAKDDIKVTTKWKPGQITVSFKLKGPRNLEFITEHTNDDPLNDPDGDITVTISFSMTITDGATTYIWLLNPNGTAEGKKKTKVSTKKDADGTVGYYVLRGYSGTLKKALLTRTQ